ncbi:hypothetical protein [Gemmata palustris]|nr:hypothetical protein [Gemmata palustris]
MTEHEWRQETSVHALLRFIAPNVSDRKLHLYEVAHLRRIAALLPLPECLAGIDVLERFADGEATREDIQQLDYDLEGAAFRFEYYGRGSSPPLPFKDHDVARAIQQLEQMPREQLEELVNDATYMNRTPREILMSAAYSVHTAVNFIPFVRSYPELMGREDCPEPFESLPHFRDIFGNPFRPVVFSPSWRTSTVVALASQMYESRDFSAMPILADALQDAGCDSADILDHCRGPGPHVRGCWVVDLVLGKT